jgi:MFS family permease
MVCGRRATRPSYGATAADVLTVNPGQAGRLAPGRAGECPHSKYQARLGVSQISTQSHGRDESAAQLHRAKLGVAAAFIAHAVVFSSWAAHIPHVKAELSLTNAVLGTALFGAPLGSVAATVGSHWALPRWGSHRLVRVTVVGYAAAGTTVGLARSATWLFLALALWGFFQGGLDVAMNTQAATVERLARAPLMARFHGMWSVGALLGAMIGAACVSAGIGLAPQLPVIGAAVLIVVAARTRQLIPDQAAGSAPAPAVGRPKRAWMTTTVAILAAVAFSSFLCEGAATDWSANYLHNVVGAGSGVSALSYAAYTLTMVVTRLGAIRLHARVFQPSTASGSGAARRRDDERDAGDGQPDSQRHRIRRVGSRRGTADSHRV